MEEGLIKYLARYITEHKKLKMEKVLSDRTRHITVVLENLHKPHNGSAVLRTAECFGIQDIHVIENKREYKANPYVTRGSGKWIDIKKYSGEGSQAVKQCFEKLKDEGYCLIATSLDKYGRSLESINIDRKIALIFGNEYEGLSDYALNTADEKLTLPMYGFTESYNISVTAAICLYNLIGKLRQSDVNWNLTDKEKEQITLEWYKGVIKHSDVLERDYFKTLNE